MSCQLHMVLVALASYATLSFSQSTTFSPDFSDAFSEASTTNYNDSQVDTGTVGPSAHSITHLASQLLTFQVAKLVTRYGSPLLVAVGLVGNTLSFLVMMQTHNRRISCCVYMAALALSDNLHLLVTTLAWAIMQFRSDGFTQIQCQFVDLLFPTSSFLGILYIVSMTVDRMLAIRFPLSSRGWITPRRARIAVAVETIVALLYNIPNVFIITRNDRGTCTVIPGAGPLVAVYTWVSVCLMSVCPFLLLLIMNCIIISAVDQQRNAFQKGDRAKSRKDSHEQTDRSTREHQLKVMLMLVSFAVLLLTLPRYIREAIMALVDVSANPQRLANFMLLNHVTARLYTANSAVNFFLYCLGGSKFRQDLAKLFRCGREDDVRKPQTQSVITESSAAA